MSPIAVFLAAIFFYSLISARVERTVLTAPMAFTAVGALTLLLQPHLHESAGGHAAFLHVAEVGLVLLLFTDASHTSLAVLRNIRNLPVRLLSTGMLLTIGLGIVAARIVFPQLTWWEAGILAAILAPTDAGLGQVIVTSPRVPLRIRQALNVEAGLNDGLSVPFLLFFIALARSEAGTHGPRFSVLVLEQLGFGIAVGLAIGLAGGILLGLCRRRHWVSDSFLHLGAFALPLACILASNAVGASMFIAAFVAGLAVQIGYPEAGRHCIEFIEGTGQILNLSVFFLFGMIVSRAWQHFEPRHAVYAVLSLTVIRMLPVAIALVGTRLSRATVLFMGWFGPRGLASIVLGLVYLEHMGSVAAVSTVQYAVMFTVLLSIVAHGASALPGMAAYARRVATLGADAPENQVEAWETEAGNLPVGGHARP